MKLKIISFMLFGILLAAPAAVLAAQVEPATLSYQGTLTDNAGQPLTDAKNIQLCLYDTQAGAPGLPAPDPANGTAFWCDNYTVTLKNGQFSVVLGRDLNPLTGVFNRFKGTTYIGVKVGTDPEMPNRQKLTSVAYAAVAASLNPADMIPPGMVVAFAGTTAPAGWLLCDGTPVSRTTYAKLFAAIGTAHGTGNGTSTFNLPDYRGRFLRGVDNDAGTPLGPTGRDPDKAVRTEMNPGGNKGNLVGSIQNHQFYTHTHDFTEWPGNDPDYTLNHYGAWVRGTDSSDYSYSATNSAGGKETRPVNAYVNWIIKY